MRRGPSYDFPRLERLVTLLRYIHRHPYCGTEEVLQQCEISEATFFRFKVAAQSLGVLIEWIEHREHSGYKIINYGLINPKKL